ncbi:MAG: GNAT family N-acetyltransferase [Cyclobacteriaceae bacterium]
MSKQKEYRVLTKKKEEWVVPIYFYQDIIPEKFTSKTITFKNNDLSIRFVQLYDQLISIPYAPWGSFSFSGEIKESSFKTLMNKIKETAKAKTVSSLVIKDVPSFYEKALPTEWYKSMGFTLRKEINQHIHLLERNELHVMQKRKLKKASKILEFHRLKDISQAYDLLYTWRNYNNIPLNIEKNHLQMLFKKFPNHYDCWGTIHGNDISAICVTIKVTSEVVYYFLPSTSPEHKAYSPMVFLMQEMSRVYKSEGFKIFDLGQSSIEGKKQEGLFLFKKRMGAQQSDKIIYELGI